MFLVHLPHLYQSGFFPEQEPPPPADSQVTFFWANSALRRISHRKAHVVIGIWSNCVLEELKLKRLFLHENSELFHGTQVDLKKKMTMPTAIPTNLLTVRSCRIDFICSQAYG